MRSDKQLVLRIEEGLISPVSGYDSTDPVKVLHEELCYNEVTISHSTPILNYCSEKCLKYIFLKSTREETTKLH